MNKPSLMSKLFVGVWALLAMSMIHATTPVWTFKPLTPTKITVPANGKATVKYILKNQSTKQHRLVMHLIPGISQVTTAGNCPRPLVLKGHKSCILNLTINGGALNGNVVGGPVLCEHGNHNQCYQPSLKNSLRITQAPTVDYTVGGSVHGLLGALILENNGGDALTLTADGSFTFSTALPPGSVYSVTVQSQPATQTCTISHGNGTITNTNVRNIRVNCSTNAHNIGGTVSGLDTTNGESVVLQNNGGDNLTISTNGSFTFPTKVAQGASYNVTVLTQPKTQTCTVMNGSDTMGGANVTNVKVRCATHSFTVGGTVSGLDMTRGESVVLQNNGADNLTISSNGLFTFSTKIAEGAKYNVTVLTQPNSQTCMVANGGGTMGGANVTTVRVTCKINSTTLTAPRSLALSVAGSASPRVARIITIKNTGSTAAVNLNISYPTFPSGTSHSTTCTNQLAANTQCTITITPGANATSDGTNPCTQGTAPIPAVVSISANNASTVSTNVVVLGYGCIYQAGYVFVLDDTQGCSSPTNCSGSVGGSVAALTDYSSGGIHFQWTPNTQITGAISPTDGIKNTAEIIKTEGAPGNYAASLCNTYQIDSTGNSPCMVPNTCYKNWYLPAICEMASTGGLYGCTAGTPNMTDNLYNLIPSVGGFTDFYWSSTEDGTFSTGAWQQEFPSTQRNEFKTTTWRVRCARAISQP